MKMNEAWHILRRHESEQNGAPSATESCGSGMCTYFWKVWVVGSRCWFTESIEFQALGKGPSNILIDFGLKEQRLLEHVQCRLLPSHLLLPYQCLSSMGDISR